MNWVFIGPEPCREESAPSKQAAAAASLRFGKFVGKRFAFFALPAPAIKHKRKQAWSELINVNFK
ncbi:MULTISPECIES: hypothetical protein [unclassified Azospirillum]|uniref:hypothetical protein n=1 Tax=unclassified Azospirillum TaxID=2630922 RepID=UPI001177BA1D|nr:MULTISPECIES: hypothetical protein [unclassified Azospirillum]